LQSRLTFDAATFCGGVVVSLKNQISLDPRAASLFVWRMHDLRASLSGDVFASKRPSMTRLRS